MTTINKPGDHPIDLRKYQTIIDTYCKNANIDIIINNNFRGLARTDVSNLKKPSMEINLEMMMNQFNLTTNEVLFIVFHEVEHLLETAALRNTSKWEGIEQKKEKKLRERGKYASTYHNLENVIRDAFVNNEVVSVRKAPVLYDTRETLFREKTHTDIDLRQFPKHIQLLHAINRECVIPEEKCLVDSNVRKIIDNLMKKSFLSGKSLIDDAISGRHLKGGKFDPNLGGRLTYMWDKIEPIFKKLFDEDMKKAKDEKNNPPENQQNQDDEEDSTTQSQKSKEKQKEDQQKQIEDLIDKLKDKQKKKKQKSEENSDKENKEGNDKEGQDSDKEGQDSDKENKEGNDKEGQDSDKEGQDSDKEGQDSDKKKPPTQANKSSQEQESNEAGEPNNKQRELDRKKDNPFEPYYERDNKQLQEILQKSLTQEQIQELVDRVTEHTKEIEQSADKSEDDIQLEQRLENMGISKDDEIFEQVKDILKHYDAYMHALENMADADTGKNAIEMIMEIFQKIKSNRGKSKIKNVGPVDIEKGSRLHGPKIAEGIAEIMAGEYNPEMFQKDVKIEYNEKESVGEFDVTVVCDGSGSMGGNKNREQKKAALLIFESLKRLYDKIQRENTLGHEQKIIFNTDGKIFFGGQTVETIKQPSPDFTDEERIKTFGLLDHCPGDTNDYSAVRETYEDIIRKGPKYMERIKKGEIKRIVLVITDGGSNDPEELKKYIRALRKLDVLVYGIGVGDEYQDVITNYNTGGNKDLGYGVPCEIAEKLPSTLLNILKPHLENL